MKKTCPICERHCQMTAPGCLRGERYFSAAQMDHAGLGFSECGKNHTPFNVHERFKNQDCPDFRKPHGHPENPMHHHEGGGAFDFQENRGSQESRLVALFYRCTHLFVHRNGQDQGKNRILSILYKHGDMMQRALLDFTDIRSASLSELLAKIEANGDIKRERSKEDGRNINISLTDKGRQAAEQIHQEHLQYTEGIFAGLSQQEKEELEKLLLKLLSSWKCDPIQQHKHHHH